MQSLIKFTYASTHYRPREGMIAFLLHRVSGLAVLLFLSLHIVDTSLVYFFPQSYGGAIALYRDRGAISGPLAQAALARLGIDQLGLDPLDRRYRHHEPAGDDGDVGQAHRFTCPQCDSVAV